MSKAQKKGPAKGFALGKKATAKPRTRQVTVDMGSKAERAATAAFTRRANAGRFTD